MEGVSSAVYKEHRSSDISALICTVGYSTVIINLEILIFGSQTNPVPSLFHFDMITIGNVMLDPMQLIILGMAVIMMIILSYITYRTKTGVAMRAISQTPKLPISWGLRLIISLI